MTTAKRGRPKKAAEDQKVRLDLLDAAKRCFLNKPYKEVTIRELADQANTNSAMINYYFGSKEGLLGELLESLLSTVFEKLARIDNIQTLPANERTRHLFHLFIQFNRENPWFAKIVVDDMMNSDPKLRQVLTEKLAKKSASMFPLFIEQQKAEGYFDPDIDNTFTIVSLLSLFTFPFLAAPILREAYGFDMNDIDIERWIEHSARLFESGVLKDSQR